MQLEIKGDKDLMYKLGLLSAIEWQALKIKQGQELLNRSRSLTPVDTGELRLSARFDGKDTFYYSKEYAPHVEYGHRTRSGGFVKGQHYLERNVSEQAPIYNQDVRHYIERKFK